MRLKNSPECQNVLVDQHILITLLFGITGEEQALADTMRSLVWLIGGTGTT